jgi:hypothetical protein
MLDFLDMSSMDVTLKVNFNMSMLTCVHVSDSWLNEATLVMNCRTGTIPFVHLGLPIGGNLETYD